MARLMPSDVSHLALAGGRTEELDTLRRLQADLPPAYTVFHGIHWSREYRNGIKFGELDFVVVNRAGQVLVIEQKNGRLEETETGLVKVYPHRAKAVGDRRTLPFKFEGANDLPGLGVGITPYEKAADQPAAVNRIVTGLLAQGFSHDDIVILTLRGSGESVFSSRQRVGGYVLRRFTQSYDLFGNQLMTPGKVLFESVRRFKEQQAPAIVLVDIDPMPDRRDAFQRLLYSGMTRATVRLELLVKADNPLNQPLLG